MWFICRVSNLVLSEVLGFEKHEGMQCRGGGADILRDFEGSWVDCAKKCTELGPECVGFVRVNSGSGYAGKCYFRSGPLEVDLF